MFLTYIAFDSVDPEGGATNFENFFAYLDKLDHLTHILHIHFKIVEL